jgi:hypothetical protein
MSSKGAPAVPGFSSISQSIPVAGIGNPVTQGVSAMSSITGSRLSARFPGATLLGSLAVFALTGLAASHALAAEPAAKPKQEPAKTTSAKPTTPKADAKATTVKTSAVRSSSRTKKAEDLAPAPAPEVEVAAADEKQLLAARSIHMGESECEFDQKISIKPSRHAGYVDLSFARKTYVMKPMITSTGALRLEDVQNEALLIQIANKTMVMNQKTGQRLVDNCVHPAQRTVTADSGPSLLK